jgi:hypothetical protein
LRPERVVLLAFDAIARGEGRGIRTVNVEAAAPRRRQRPPRLIATRATVCARFSAVTSLADYGRRDD